MTTDTIVRVDPKTLLIGPNVRKNTKLSKAFVDSIREIGVRTPIVAVETADGLEVIDGQRRTLGAIEAGYAEVPVFVTTPQTAAERIVDQVVVNELREEIDEAEAIAAVTELALFNIAVPAMVSQTGLTEKFVHRAVKIGGSAAAQKAIAEHQLSFDYALMIAEFDESPEDQAELMKLAAEGGTWQVKEKAQELLDARDETRILEEIKASGVKVVKDPGYYSDEPKKVSYLFVDKAMKKPLSEQSHEKLVALAGDGLRAYPSKEWVDGGRIWTTAYAVAGWEERGLFGHKSNARTNDADKTPEEAAKAKEERRVARENTKAWVEASVPRIEFLQSLVAKKTMPTGWGQLVALRLLSNASHSTTEWRLAHVILGLKETADSYSLSGNVRSHLEKNPLLALKIALTMWAAEIEGRYEFDRKGWSHGKVAKAYLEKLEGWGYELSDVEMAACGRKVRKFAAAS